MLPAPLMILGSAVVCMFGALTADVPAWQVQATGLVVAIELTVAWVAVGRGYTPYSLTLLCGCVVALFALPDVNDIHTGASLANTTYLLVCVGTLRPSRLMWFVLPSVAGLLAASTLHSSIAYVTVLDLSVLNMGMVFAGAAFVSVASDAARRRDVIAVELAEVELALRLQQSRDESDEAMRRVLHDEVLAAVRAVVELPNEESELIRKACRDAVRAVQLTGAPHG